MLKRSQHWVLSGIGVACVLLVLLDMFLYSGNQALQARVSQRAQYVQQSAQLQGLYQQIARAVAELSVRNSDDRLRQLLAKQGIQVTASSQGPAAAAPAQADPKPLAARIKGQSHE